jgi:uncharacterized protein (TIGR04255 family)
MLNALAPRLKDPPIIEVVCGFFFSPVAGLDPLVVGKYWAEKKDRDGYHERQLHPAVSDRPGISVSETPGPFRCWLIKDTDDYILQIQPDRFYFNWRKRKSGYPHFTDKDGSEGVLTKSLREFDEFRRFCETESAIKQALKPLRFELAKIDLLLNPAHWKDYSDLTSVVPLLGKLPPITDEPSLNLSLVGQRDGFLVHFGLTNGALAPDMSQAVKIETLVTAPATHDVGSTLALMNATANNIFFDTLSASELHRFGGLIQ